MQRISKVLVPAMFGLGGLLMTFHPMILSGLTRQQVDMGDTRHLNFVLEHDYRAMTGDPAHSDVFSPPVFYPVENTGAYSEVLLGVAPFYGLFRLAGAPPDTSMQLFMLLTSLLNFAAAYWFLRALVGTSVVASSLGAFLFAYGSIRGVQIGHQHLIPHFFTVLAVAACFLLFREAESERRRRRWIALFFAALVAQLYGSFYLGWLLCFGLMVAAVVGLAFADTRAHLLAVVRAHAITIAVASGASAAALAPLMVHYLRAARTVGMRDFSTAASMLIPLQAWLDQGPFSWLYGRMAKQPLFSGMTIEWEKRLGLGLITFGFVAAGFWKSRRRPFVRVLALTTLVIIVLATTLPGGFTLWRGVFEVVPGAKAIRAVARLALLLLLPFSCAVALAFDRLTAWARPGNAVLLGALILLEQGQTMPSYAKAPEREQVARVAAAVPAGCRAFYYTATQSMQPFFITQLDGMWASMISDVPTVNGYSSNLPPSWIPLLENDVRTDADPARLSSAVDAWAQRHQVDPRSICRVSVPSERAARVDFVDLPETLTAGEAYMVTARLTNLGWATWTPERQFRLGEPTQTEPNLWGTTRVDVPGAVPPATTATLQFRVVAPRKPGAYPFRWQMVEENVAWFGIPLERTVRVAAPQVKN